jgi:hypothetical protein
MVTELWTEKPECGHENSSRVRVLVEQAGALKEADDLVAEELLGAGGVEIRHGDPLAGCPAAAGDEGVHVRVQVELIAEGLDHRDHAWAETPLTPGRHSHQLAGGRRGRGVRALLVMHEVRAQEPVHRRGEGLDRRQSAPRVALDPAQVTRDRRAARGRRYFGTSRRSFPGDSPIRK